VKLLPHYGKIAAASFQPIKDLQTIYLSWLSVSSMKAEFGKWNTKKTKKNQLTNGDVKSFFYGSTFSNGKVIGSTLLAAVQYICSSLVPTQPPMSRCYYETIICQ
jgi:threonine/homoserine/homoserine lactone efflux protein